MTTMSKQPKTKSALAKHRYGTSDKNPKGQSYDPNQCGCIIYEQRTPTLNWQCSRKNGYGTNGLWCANHATSF